MAATARKKASSSPRPAANVAVAEIDDILGEIDAPAKIEADDALDTVADAGFSFEDILGEFDAPPPANGDGLDDILDEIALSEQAPAQTELAEGPDDGLDALVPPPAPAAANKLDDALANPPVPAGTGDGSKLDEAPDAHGTASPEAPASAESAIEESEKKPAKRGRSLPKPGLQSLSGTRQISRKAYLGLIGLTGLFALTTAVETAFIAMHGFNHGETKPKAVVVTMAPVDYAQIDLTRYVGKRRALREGGRDVLRNGAVKAAILELDNGEDLYRDIRDIARHSPAADHMTIADNRLTVASCDTALCGDKSFRLVYDLAGKHASVCMTEKYVNNSMLSYSYSEEGYSEVAGCH